MNQWTNRYTRRSTKHSHFFFRPLDAELQQQFSFWPRGRFGTDCLRAERNSINQQWLMPKACGHDHPLKSQREMHTSMCSSTKMRTLCLFPPVLVLPETAYACREPCITLSVPDSIDSSTLSVQESLIPPVKSRVLSTEEHRQRRRLQATISECCVAMDPISCT